MCRVSLGFTTMPKASSMRAWCSIATLCRRLWTWLRTIAGTYVGWNPPPMNYSDLESWMSLPFSLVKAVKPPVQRQQKTCTGVLLFCKCYLLFSNARSQKCHIYNLVTPNCRNSTVSSVNASMGDLCFFGVFMAYVFEEGFGMKESSPNNWTLVFKDLVSQRAVLCIANSWVQWNLD